MRIGMTARLHEDIAAVCPIVGVSVGRAGKPETVRIDFKPEATAKEREKAAEVLAKFDWSEEEDAKFLEKAGKDKP